MVVYVEGVAVPARLVDRRFYLSMTTSSTIHSPRSSVVCRTLQAQAAPCTCCPAAQCFVVAIDGIVCTVVGIMSVGWAFQSDTAITLDVGDGKRKAGYQCAPMDGQIPRQKAHRFLYQVIGYLS